MFKLNVTLETDNAKIAEKLSTGFVISVEPIEDIVNDAFDEGYEFGYENAINEIREGNIDDEFYDDTYNEEIVTDGEDDITEIALKCLYFNDRDVICSECPYHDSCMELYENLENCGYNNENIAETTDGAGDEESDE